MMVIMLVMMMVVMVVVVMMMNMMVVMMGVMVSMKSMVMMEIRIMAKINDDHNGGHTNTSSQSQDTVIQVIMMVTYLIFDTCTTCGAGVKFVSLVAKYQELMCFWCFLV